MAVKIRLRRMGAKKKPFYRVVVTETRAACSSDYLEAIGTYNPLDKEKSLAIDADRARAWMAKGATPTPSVQTLLKRLGIFAVAAKA
ncbi:MAG TPA: 30S ribosomal protein S16 [bacterium]|nr:30S ribosomal protein S16 [bacterium]